MNGSSKINSYLMSAKCTVSYYSVGFVVPGDSTYNQLQIKLIMIDMKLTLLMQGVIYLFYNLNDFL